MSRRHRAPQTRAERIQEARDQLEKRVNEVLETIDTLRKKRKDILTLRRRLTGLEKALLRPARRTPAAPPPPAEPPKEGSSGPRNPARARVVSRFRDRFEAQAAAKAKAGPPARPRRGGKRDAK